MQTSPKKPCNCPDGERSYYMAQNFGRARMQPDGSLMYQKKGPEPPPDIDGFKRDPRNHWRFIPQWTRCDYRFQSQHIKKCGAVGILTICTHPEGPKENRQEVNFSRCEGCPLKKIK